LADALPGQQQVRTGNTALLVGQNLVDQTQDLVASFSSAHGMTLLFSASMNRIEVVMGCGEGLSSRCA
jgi:hypothetical protein